MTRDILFFKLKQPKAIPLFLSWPFLSAALLHHHQNHLHGWALVLQEEAPCARFIEGFYFSLFKLFFYFPFASC